MQQRGSPHRRIWVAAALAAGIVAGAASDVRAAGFAIIEQSVSGLGNAFAGGAASAEDASTIFFNPAGLMRLKGTQAIVGAHAIKTSFKFDNSNSKHVTGAPLSGDDGGNGGTLGVVPNIYLSSNPGKGWAVGLGINAPFGLTTNWDKGWVGRYHALKSSVTAVDINPTVAVDLGGGVSFGAGFNAMHMSAELSQAIDFGTALYQMSAGKMGIPQGNDGKATLKADDWSYGFNVGLLWELTANTRIGAQYRSRVTEKLDGNAKFDKPAAYDTVLSTIYPDKTDANGSITLPDSASLSAYHRFSPQWAVMADATWTHWSVFDELKINFEDMPPGRDTSITTENWKDAWRFSAGLTFNPTPAWPIRIGVAYDQTPIPDSSHRTPRLPDNDRIWASVGTGYQIAGWLSFDIGYTHLFVKDAEINKSAVGEDASRGALKGDFTNSADIVSAQVAMRW